MKGWYKWLMKHDIGVIRFLYLSPVFSLFFRSEAIFQAVILFDVAISLTLQYGNTQCWWKENERK